MTVDGMQRIALSVTQQNSDLDSDSTEFADKEKRYTSEQAEMCRKDKMDSPIHTNYIPSGGATALIFIVDGAHALGSLVTRSTVPWNKAEPPDGIKLAYEFLRMSASHSMLNRREVSWMSLASLHSNLARKNFRASTFTLVEQTLENSVRMEPRPSLP